MTPEPEPDPDPPSPTSRTIHVKCTTQLNNSQMFILQDKLNYYSDLNGGKVVIQQYTDLDITIAPTSSEFQLAVRAMGYNNQHTDWQDYYYSNATIMTSQDSVGYVAIAPTVPDGSTLTINQTDGTNYTYVWS